MTKALIFDCFGVLYLGSRDYLYQRVSSINYAVLSDLNRASDYGYIDETEYLQEVAELTGLSVGELKELFRESHRRNDELVELIRQYRGMYKIGLLSNVGSGVMDGLFSQAERSEFFDEVVLSNDVNLVKPHPEIYTLMADKLGVEPGECIMIDDMPDNVRGAEMVGMQGVVYKTTNDLQMSLQNML